MEDVPTTNLTVAKLKALCVLNDVSATGKKSELLQRLLDAGVDNETLGIEVFDDTTATFQSTADGHEVVHEDETEIDTVGGAEEKSETPAAAANDSSEPVMLSLEDDDTLTPASPSPEPTTTTPSAKHEVATPPK